MLPYVLVAGAAAFFVNRLRPKTKVRKKEAIGPRTGLYYHVEDFPTSAFIVVHAVDRSAIGTFAKTKTGFRLIHGVGSPETLKAMKEDFER